METYDVVVAGLGAAGSSAVRHLAAAGLSVLGLERYGPVHTMGSSHGGTRIVRHAYAEGDAFVPLLARAHHLWDELAEPYGAPLLHRTGMLISGGPGAPAVAATIDCARRFGMPHQVLDAEGIRALSPPGTAVPDDAVGCLDVRAGYVRPEEALALHHRLAEEDGARLRFREPLLSFTCVRGGVTVRTHQETYSCGHLVLCGGAWSRRLLPGLPVPVRPQRQVQHWFDLAPEAAGHFAPERFPVHVWQDPGLFYVMPAVDGPDGGLKCCAEGDPPPCDPDTLPREASPAEIAEAEHQLRRHLAGTGRWRRAAVCTYPQTPDNHFLLGAAPGHESVWLATGLGGHGFKFLPVLGEVVLGMVDGTPRFPDEVLAPFAPDRTVGGAGTAGEDGGASGTGGAAADGGHGADGEERAAGAAGPVAGRL